MTFIPRELYGIIGWPLAQTLSPLLHNTAFQTLDIPAAYMAWPVEPQQLEDFLRGLRLMKIMGCSVTIPHKLAVMPLLDSISESASLAGAVNTLFWRGDCLCGENTDVSGFLAPLARLRLDSFDALLLGAGGAAHAAAAGLKLRGCRQLRVATPSNRRQPFFAERFGCEPILWEERYQWPANLVINATPLGMKGENVDKTPYDFDKAPPMENRWAYDLVYNPLHTRFLREAKKAGCHVISGMEMFYCQADAQFMLWTGRHLPDECARALEKALNKD